MFGVPHVFYIFVFFKSVGIGFLIGSIYAFFSALRNFWLRKRWIVAIQDILFFLFASVLTFLLVFDVNAGVIRAYILVGEGAGALLFTLVPAAAIKTALLKLICFTDEKRGRKKKRKRA